MTNWKNRIVRAGSEDPNQLLANEWNWRIHPREQQDAIEAALDEVGWVQDVIVNLRSSELWGNGRNIPSVLDGHARIKIALRRDQKAVPVKYVDLTPIEEKKMLIALDRTTEMAHEDSAMLLDLINSLENEGEIPTVDEDEVDRLVLLSDKAPTRPDFSNLIDDLSDVVQSGSDKDGNWFYIEFYGQDELFKRLTEALSDNMEGDHEISNEYFSRLVLGE